MITVYDFLDLCDACEIDASKLRIAVFAIERTDPKTMTFKVSYDDIAKGVGVSYATVARTMKLLQSQNMIAPVTRGVWKWTMQIFEPAIDEYDDLASELSVFVKNYMSA